ncbi:MAG TPA: hypothetical protein VFF09_00190 [archaeon]|nr:hypothetical protein [archaeon]
MGFLEISGSVKSYLQNLSTVLSFALLFIFVLPFTWLSNSFISSGSILLDYGFARAPPAEMLVLFLLVLAFLFFYSVFVCLLVFAVRKDLSKVKVNYYLREKIHKFAFKYFYFLAAFTLIAVSASTLLISQGVDAAIINLGLFIAASAFIFLPQTIVVDEESLSSSVASNFDFIAKNFAFFIGVLLFGIIAVFVLQLFEFAVDFFILAGNYFSLIIAVLVLAPFLEVLKTRVYMKRFSLVATYHPG